MRSTRPDSTHASTCAQVARGWPALTGRGGLGCLAGSSEAHDGESSSDRIVRSAGQLAVDRRGVLGVDLGAAPALLGLPAGLSEGDLEGVALLLGALALVGLQSRGRSCGEVAEHGRGEDDEAGRDDCPLRPHALTGSPS